MKESADSVDALNTLNCVLSLRTQDDHDARLHVTGFVVQSLSRVQLFATPWTEARQASLSFTISQSLLKLMSIESAMPSGHLILCCPLLLLPSIFPSIRVIFVVKKKNVFLLQLKFFKGPFTVARDADWLLVAVGDTVIRTGPVPALGDLWSDGGGGAPGQGYSGCRGEQAREGVQRA